MLPFSETAIRAVPTYLAPNFMKPFLPTLQCAYASTNGPRSKKGLSRHRGVSALRRTGPRHVLSVSKEPLPQPVLDPAKRSKVQVRENHGLWDFFSKERRAPITPEQMAAHGKIKFGLSRMTTKCMQGAHGPLVNYASSRSKTFTACGGCV
jgi:hypothetical protein